MKSVFYDIMIAKVFHLIVYLQSLSYTSKVKDENVKKKKNKQKNRGKKKNYVFVISSYIAGSAECEIFLSDDISH